MSSERCSVTTTLIPESHPLISPATSPVVEDPFALDVRIITDVPPGDALAGCKGGTDDGCDPTCASACVSDGV